MIVFIGPRRDYPSWHWIGEDTASELRKYFTIEIFDKYPTSKQHVSIFVKNLPPIDEIGEKSIYLPVDYFNNISHIKHCSKILSKFSLILSHSFRLVNVLKKYNKNTHYIDHHLKYVAAQEPTYKKNGYILWVGGFQYLPIVLNWLEKNNINLNLKILTDNQNENAILACKQRAKELNYDFNKIEKLDVYTWTENLQLQMLSEAKAALDIKGNDFNQQHKPSTKAQKFIASGLPLAMNPSESVDYMSSLGFNIKDPKDTSWLSYEYWLKTQELGKLLRENLSLENIGRKYKQLISQL